MSQVLGKVTFDLDGPRGPDVKLEIQVPSSWFGTRVLIALPRNLSCAVCEGGGCDACERMGAVSLRGHEQTTVPLSVHLPKEGETDVCLRVPSEGGFAEGLPRGHLLLVVRRAEEPSSFVQRDQSADQQSANQTTGAAAERLLLMKRSLVMAAVLILLFLGMLRLSGWL